MKFGIKHPLFEAVTEVAPAGGTPPAPPVVTPPPAQPQPPAPGQPPDPAWLNPRIDAAKAAAQNALLAQLGVSTIAEAEAKLKAAKALEDAGKTEAEKTAARLAALEAEATSGRAALAAVKVYADTAMAGLTDAQRAAVKAVAGEDSARQLTTIEALRPTWAAAPAKTAAEIAAEEAAKSGAKQPPANTAPPAGTAPAGTQPTSPPDYKALYTQLKKTNPVAAAHLLRNHQKEIYPSAS